MKKNVKKKYMVVLIVLLMLAVFGIVLGISYAFFTTTVKTKEFVIYTGNLAVDYTKKTDVIDIENLYPMTNEQGLEQPSHEFTVTNNGTLTARYQIRLELDDTIENIPIEYIKLSYSKDGSEYSTPILLSNLNSSLAFIKDAVITSNQSNTYAIKLWIDLNASNDIQGKEFRARVVVDSIQNVEDGYVVDTVPIVTLNKDTEGNHDIHLKVGETYTELGVKSIEDDKDILTLDEVEKTYEYYDGENLTTVNSIDTTKTGIYYITYSVTDSNNNKGTAIRIITVNKTEEIPTIELNGEEIIKVGETETYTELGVTVENNNQVAIIGEVKNKAIGTYIIRYIVIDENGNLNSVIRTVKVVGLYQEEILNGATPVLTNNLIPVQIADDGTVTKARLYDEWYDYETKRWANAVVLKDTSVNYTDNQTIPESNIESYFVWIPKYSYKIWDLGNYTGSTTLDNSKVHAINIKFGLTNTSDANTGECTTPMNASGTQGLAGESGNCQVGDYMTHPAFLAFDANGLWIAKFITGYDGATTKDEALINSSDTSKIVIKPNVYSWRDNQLGNAFKLCFEYLRSDESHLMKNTEWGAMTYLSHSIYGINTLNNSARPDNYMTGYTKDTITNMLASTTTGNITGIFDIPYHQFVAGFNMYQESFPPTIADDYAIENVYSDFYTNPMYHKYYDAYYVMVSEDDSNAPFSHYNNRILGDATGELGPFEKVYSEYAYIYSSWWGTQMFFVNQTDPYFIRAGYLVAVHTALNGGGDIAIVGSRIVLAPTK